MIKIYILIKEDDRKDPYMPLDPADFFNLLESNKLLVVEDI
jgi:hypothetical protein